MGVAELITLSNMELTRFFFAIVLLLVSAHWFGYIFQRFKMPRVIGEIVGGLVLGPTLLGFFAPNIYNWIFNAFEAEGKLISIIYWFGLVLLMFISGFEIQKSFSKGDKKTIFALLVGATAIPFLAGWIAPSFYDFSPLIGSAGNMLALKIVIAIAVAVTSIPVISKIFIDLKIMDTKFAKIVNLFARGKIMMIGHYSDMGVKIRNEILDDFALEMFWFIDNKRASGGRAAIIPLISNWKKYGEK